MYMKPFVEMFYTVNTDMMMTSERGSANVEARKHNGSLTNKHNDFDGV